MNKRFLPFVALIACIALACNLSSPTPPPAENAPAENPIEAGETPAIEATSPSSGTASEPVADPPEQPVKLIFIHHSSGENWLADSNGGLGIALHDNNYFVSDTNYDWGPYDPDLGGPVGSYTDTGQWYNWFLGPRRDEVFRAVLDESSQHAEYTRLDDDPGGENQIIMFKSCFPNSALNGNPGDPPNLGDNLLFGLDAGSENHTVANAKGVYMALRDFFATHPDKLFIAVTAPPLHESATSPEQAANARAFNRWLTTEWLKDYPLHNIAVFDFYNVLTSNGGDPDTNDAGADTGNHHRYKDGQVEYITDQGSDTSAYATADDSHPTSAGNQKATEEFLPILNIAYHRWSGK